MAAKSGRRTVNSAMNQPTGSGGHTNQDDSVNAAMKQPTPKKHQNGLNINTAAGQSGRK